MSCWVLRAGKAKETVKTEEVEDGDNGTSELVRIGILSSGYRVRYVQ
jgi:hypothetical protein